MEEYYKNLSLEDLPNEEWRDVVGYEGCYKCSNLGRVKSLARPVDGGRFVVEERIKKQTIANTGYCVVNLYKGEGKRQAKTKTAHRIIAEAFIPNPENKPCIDHINTIRTDNRIENIRWVSYSENCANAITKEKLSNTYKEKAKDPKRREYLRLLSQNYSKTEEAKKKWRESNSTPEQIERQRLHRAKSVLQLDMEGNIINEFISIAEAQRITGAKHISSCCSGKRKYALGYIWKYKENN